MTFQRVTSSKMVTYLKITMADWTLETLQHASRDCAFNVESMREALNSEASISTPSSRKG